MPLQESDLIDRSLDSGVCIFKKIFQFNVYFSQGKSPFKIHPPILKSTILFQTCVILPVRQSLIYYFDFWEQVTCCLG